MPFQTASTPSSEATLVKKKKFSIFFFLFSLPFLLGGLAALYATYIKVSAEGFSTTFLPPLLIGLLFTVGGVGLMFGAPRLVAKTEDEALRRAIEAKASSRRDQEDDEDLEEEEIAPWLDRADWAKGKIEYNNQGAMYGLWIFTIIWLIVSCGANYDTFVEVFDRGDYSSAPFLIFPLIGLLLLLLAVYGTLRWKKFGASVFEIHNQTGYLGGELRGVIRSSTQIAASGDYTIKLKCVEKITTGSGKSQSTKIFTRWEQEKRIPSSGANAMMGIPVGFSIPETCYESGDDAAPGRVDWYLSVHAPVSGLDYSADFTVPVFRRRKAAQP